MENNCKRLSVADCKHNFPRVRFHFNVLSFLEEKLAVKYCITVILDHRQRQLLQKFRGKVSELRIW